MELNKNELENLKAGLAQPFWQAIKKHLTERVEFLQNQILEDDSLIEEIRITNRDLLRKEYKVMKWLLELPEKLIIGEKEYQPKMSDFDPYEKSKE